MHSGLEFMNLWYFLNGNHERKWNGSPSNYHMEKAMRITLLINFQVLNYFCFLLLFFWYRQFFKNMQYALCPSLWSSWILNDIHDWPHVSREERVIYSQFVEIIALLVPGLNICHYQGSYNLGLSFLGKL
jgi:hypothetical protein